MVKLTDDSPYVSRVPGYLKTHIIMTVLDSILKIIHEVDYKRKIHLIYKESKHGDRKPVYFHLQCTTVGPLQ